MIDNQKEKEERISEIRRITRPRFYEPPSHKYVRVLKDTIRKSIYKTKKKK